MISQFWADWICIHDALRHLREVPGRVLAAQGPPLVHRRTSQARSHHILPVRRQLQRASIL